VRGGGLALGLGQNPLLRCAVSLNPPKAGEEVQRFKKGCS